MKHNIINFSIMMASAMALASCGGGVKSTESKGADSAAQAGAGAQAYQVDVTKSTVKWKGFNTLGYEHFGSMNIKSGTLQFEGAALKAGKFVMDMTSMKCEDLTDAEKNKKLIAHLSDTDFFAVSKFPEATFEITGISSVPADSVGNNSIIEGNLTLKNVTRNIAFPAKVAVNGNQVNADGKVVINRLDWGVNYKREQAGLAEKAMMAIKDGVVKKEMEIRVNITALK